MSWPGRSMQFGVCVSEVDEERRKELALRGVPEPCCQSELWERSVRDNVTDNKIPEQVRPQSLFSAHPMFHLPPPATALCVLTSRS